MYNSRIVKLINKKGQLQSSIIIDELPTIYFRGLDYISTARSNRISSLFGFQDFSQLTRDYGDKESKVIQNIVGNIFSGQVVGETAKALSERFGKVLQKRQSLTINQYNLLICGIGKVNAAYHLTKTIQQAQPKLIVNLGSAGSNFYKKGEIVCCTKFIQRDMDVRGLGYEQYKTPLSGLSTILEYGLLMDGIPEAICGTGDSFEMAQSDSLYNIVDMEAYALALVAMKENIPFLCLKFISDGADKEAAEDWMVQVHKTAAAFKSILTLGR